MTAASKPILWLFSGSDHVGMITLMEMNMSSVPHVMESFVACHSRICCAERVQEEGVHNMVPYIPNMSVWVGTMSGRYGSSFSGLSLPPFLLIYKKSKSHDN